MTYRCKDDKRVYNRLLKELSVGRSYTKIGVQEGTNRKDKKGMSKAVVVAAANEFGAPSRHIPSRPAMRTAFDMHKSEVVKMQTAALKKIHAGRMTVNSGLFIIGSYMETAIKKSIEDWTTPSNALSTQKAKGEKVGEGVLVDNPLQDTNQYLQSIRHVEVVTK